ncbi:MAG: choice-of-anchor tandem repeat GloVer-containing protein [Verrucomicrobiota bacterium]|jgi:uncharacterized repeat protein (TIGR03803 family)
MKTTRISNRRAFLTAAVLSFACLTAIAQDYRVLHNFAGGASDGARAYGSLIQSGSTLYGMTFLGGSNSLGTVFRMNPDGTGFQLLHSFNSAGNDGQKPIGSLILSGSTLYGMTACEDTSYGGTVFQIQTDGSRFSVLRRFSGTDGKWPYGDLVQSGGMLYGLNTFGGSDTGSGWVGNGTVFQTDTNGTVLPLLHTFTGSPGDGGWPHGSLIQSGPILYGMTAIGGSNDNGTIFKINTNGTPYQILHTFTGGSNDGAGPGGTLLQSDAILYGMTGGGGNSGNGTIFEINTTNMSFRLLHSFSGGSNDGAGPVGALVQRDAILYGMTGGGGSSGNGTIFEINTTNMSFRLLHSFSGGDGSQPFGSLLLSGSTLYGMTYAGGSHGQGVIFGLDLLPKLAIAPNDTNVNLSWSTNYPGFVLESIDQLNGTWTSVPGVTGCSATLPVSADSQFFRLRK